MALLNVKHLNFSYDDQHILHNISFVVERGELVTIFGTTGSGKSTLLKLLKPEMRPNGQLSATITLDGEELQQQNALKVGYVSQRPQEQSIMETVWQELAFGLENIGVGHEVMQQKIGEVASFFGIHKWLYKRTSELSGGQLQLLNVASALLMEPELLLLDEPTSQLDPIAAGEFIQMLQKINVELGITILVVEHRLEELLAISDRVMYLQEGRIVHDATPSTIGYFLKDDEMLKALPAATQIFCHVNNTEISPVTVKDGINFVSQFQKQQLELTELAISAPFISVKNIYFRYNKKQEDIVANTSFFVAKGEIFTIVGGNGVGKSTLLTLLAAVNNPYKGSIKIEGELLKKRREKIVLLPQNPQLIFMQSTVEEELKQLFQGSDEAVSKICEELEIMHLLKRNPFDLSGGEQQKVALAKLLLLEPDILLLDEPTKGVDAAFKEQYKNILHKLQQQGLTMVIVTHDIDFAATVSDRCALFFDRQLVAMNTPHVFFSQNRFYTTSACRIARHRFFGAITTEQVIHCCQQQIDGGIVHEQHFSASVT